MAAEHEIAALAARGERSVAEAARHRVKMMFERQRVRSYREVFLAADDKLTVHGRAVIADLAKISQLGRVDPRASEAELRFREGQRAIVLHMLASFDLDEAKFSRMARQLRESEHE